MRAEVVALVSCAGLLAGCATAPRVAPIDSGSQVAFVVVMSPPNAGEDAGRNAAVRNSAVRHGAGSGAKSGAAAGALYGLLCGPAFVVCSPLAAFMGAGVGAAAGAAVGLAETLPKDKVAQLNDRLKRLQQSHDPVLELRANVLERAARHWTLTDDISTRLVTLEVQGLYLTADRNEDIALVMQVLVSHRTSEPGSTSSATISKRFSVVSQGNSLSAWLDERSDIPEAQLRNACQQIATQVVSELAFN